MIPTILSIKSVSYHIVTIFFGALDKVGFSYSSFAILVKLISTMTTAIPPLFV